MIQWGFAEERRLLAIAVAADVERSAAECAVTYIYRRCIGIRGMSRHCHADFDTFCWDGTLRRSDQLGWGRVSVSNCSLGTLWLETRPVCCLIFFSWC